jgi:hypothetical protein
MPLGYMAMMGREYPSKNRPRDSCGDWLRTVVHGYAGCNGRPVVNAREYRYLQVEHRIRNQPVGGSIPLAGILESKLMASLLRRYAPGRDNVEQQLLS